MLPSANTIIIKIVEKMVKILFKNNLIGIVSVAYKILLSNYKILLNINYYNN